MTTNIIILLLAINYIADQLFQHPFVVKNKDQSTAMMIVHVLTWGLCMWAFTMVMCYKLQSWEMTKWFVLITFAHFLIEWPLNRWSTSLLYRKKYVWVNAINLLEALLVNAVVASSFTYFLFR